MDNFKYHEEDPEPDSEFIFYVKATGDNEIVFSKKITLEKAVAALNDISEQIYGAELYHNIADLDEAKECIIDLVPKLMDEEIE